jgi:WD40 repeat protein
MIYTSKGKLIVGSSEDINIYSSLAANQSAETTMKGHYSYVYSLLLSDDESVLYSGAEDKSIKKWDLNS